MKAILNGFLPGLILVLNPVINFVFYEGLKKYFEERVALTFKSIFLISMVSKFIASTVTYPILTIKTKAFTSKTSEPLFGLLASIIKREGIRGLYRGLTAKIVQTLLYNAFMMMFFENIRARIANAAGVQIK